MSLVNSQLELIASYLRWIEVGFDSILLILNIYILFIVQNIQFINTIEWKFTKICLILDILYTIVGIIYYPIYTRYPEEILLCQIAGTVRCSFYALCIGSVLILIIVRYVKYILIKDVNDCVWYIVFASFIIVDLSLCLYFAILKKMRPTLLGYCFIDPLLDQSSRSGYLFVLAVGIIAIVIIVANYCILCRLGLKMGSYIDSEELEIDKNSIIEKSIIVVITKCVSIVLTYIITIAPKIASVAAQLVTQKPINPLFELVADFLFSLNTIPNLLTTILLNSIIRERLKFISFK
jgi:hypothetical protein